MSKLTFQIIVIGIVIAAAATLNIRGVQASEGAVILQISVRAQSTANYDVDTDFGTIPAISIDIVEDKINDQSSAGLNPLFTPLPTTAHTQDNSESAGSAPQSISEPQDSPLPQASPTPQGNTIVISGLNGNAEDDDFKNNKKDDDSKNNKKDDEPKNNAEDDDSKNNKKDDEPKNNAEDDDSKNNKKDDEPKNNKKDDDSNS